MIDEAGVIKELRDCCKRAEDLTRQLGYARLDSRWIIVNSLFANLREKVDQLIIAKKAQEPSVKYRTKEAWNA